MKKSVIADIFNGKRGCIDSMQKNNENRETRQDLFMEFKEKLSPELFKLYMKLDEAYGVYLSDEVDYYFTQGFKLGLLIGIECLEQ